MDILKTWIFMDNVYLFKVQFLFRDPTLPKQYSTLRLRSRKPEIDFRSPNSAASGL